MTVDQGIVLFTLVAAVVLFSFDWLAVDVVALALLTFLVVTGVLPADMAFRGFGSDATLLILGLLILTAGLNRTGVVDNLGRGLLRHAGDNHLRIILIIMVTSTLISSFMSNTAATAVMIPISIGLARKARLSTSRILLPLAFASILSSSVTLISTSTNVVVSGIMTQHGLSPITMFELSPVGIPITIAGIIYMLLVGVRLIPKRIQQEERFEEMGTIPYFAEMVIPAGSPLIDKTLEESKLGSDLDLNVVRLIRKKNPAIIPYGSLRLKEGDILIVESDKGNILRIKEIAGIDLTADARFGEMIQDTSVIKVAEAIVLLRSPLVGRTLKSTGFREHYGVQILAVNRHGETIQQKLSQVVFQLGDVLLIQGERTSLAALEADQAFRLVGEVVETKPNARRAPLAIVIFLLAIAAASLGIFSLPVSVLIGVVAMFITRCITPEEAYRDVEWKAVILISCMLGLGAAMEHTGTANFLAEKIVDLVGDSDPRLLLAGFFGLTMFLTQPMSNQAAAAVVVPIALQTAAHLGVNPRSFAMMIAIGASCSFLTPLEPSCLMVYGPGRYRFADFFKVGLLLTIIIFIIAMVMVPVLWPL